MPRTSRGRSYRGLSSVFTPGAGAQRFNPRFSANASRPSKLGPDVASVLAPQVEAMAPQGPIFDELPPPDVEYGLGGVEGPGSSLIDAILAEEPSAAATGGPYGGTSGSPESDAALLGAEATYGTPGNETPLSAATQESMVGSSPGASLEDVVPGYTPPGSNGGLYTGDMLLKKLMQLGI